MPRLPTVFDPVADQLATCASAIELACGGGSASLWLASHGADVTGYDVSPIAIAQARQAAVEHGLEQTCRFDVVDLDNGLPSGDQVELVLCHMFRDAALDESIRSRLAPKGLVAIACLSEVGAAPGRFRATPGELNMAFSDLTPLISGEQDGVAWLVARSA